MAKHPKPFDPFRAHRIETNRHSLGPRFRSDGKKITKLSQEEGRRGFYAGVMRRAISKTLGYDPQRQSPLPTNLPGSLAERRRRARAHAEEAQAAKKIRVKKGQTPGKTDALPAVEIFS